MQGIGASFAALQAISARNVFLSNISSHDPQEARTGRATVEALQLNREELVRFRRVPIPAKEHPPEEL